MPKPNDKQLQMILEDMVVARTQAGRLWNLQRQGQVGTIAPIDGHEGAVVGAVHALETESDWVLPQYREPLGLRKYGPEVLDTFMLYNLGHPAGGHIPDPIKVTPSQISLGASIPHAVGLAWGMRLKDEDGVVLVFFGDGASSEGDFYEAGNLAGVLKVPVIFLCINNQWAISTPTHMQTAADSFASKAEAFGIPGITVDGNDPSSVYEAVSDARIRATSGKGGAWEICAMLSGFPGHTNALSCEWRIKCPSGRPGKREKKYQGVKGRITSLNEILSLERWTGKCTVDNCDFNFKLHILKDVVHFLDKSLVPANIEVIEVETIDAECVELEKEIYNE